jgi:hypothetical protein
MNPPSACATKAQQLIGAIAPMSQTAAGGSFDTFDMPQIEFLGEQDGTAEGRLKNELAKLLREDRSVAAAYLARVRYDGQTSGVVLGLASDDDESERLVGQIGAVFASLVNARAHLDIVFLSDEQHIAIRKVCAPFYERSRGRWR